MKLIETIRVTDGVYDDPVSHLERMVRSRAEVFGGEASQGFVLPKVPEEFRSARVKCRIVYDAFSEQVSFSHYHPKTVRSLRLVECDGIDYHLKYADRSPLEELLARKGDCDEILIVRHGCVTDTSYSNVVFAKGDRLYVPDTFLLDGCMRRRLIESGTVTPVRITPGDIARYDSVSLINAMLDAGEIVIPAGEVR